MFNSHFDVILRHKKCTWTDFLEGGIYRYTPRRYVSVVSSFVNIRPCPRPRSAPCPHVAMPARVGSAHSAGTHAAVKDVRGICPAVCSSSTAYNAYWAGERTQSGA